MNHAALERLSAGSSHQAAAPRPTKDLAVSARSGDWAMNDAALERFSPAKTPSPSHEAAAGAWVLT